MKKKSINDFYPTKAIAGVPAFKSLTEEAGFWDTHSFTDFPEYWSEDVKIIFDLEKPRDATLIVRLQKEVKDKVKKLARSKGIDTSGIVRKFILDGMRAEMASN